MAGDPRYKQCPDCAEQVLAAARKCRYCGYRFDTGRAERGPLLGGLLPGRSQDRDVSLPELLADWSFEQAEGEQVVRFTFATVDRRAGYLLLTTERLVFFEHVSRGRQEIALEYPLDLLLEVSLHGGIARRRIELSGEGFAHVVDAGGSAATRALHANLTEHADPAGRERSE